jgi:hypothetical protein
MAEREHIHSLFAGSEDDRAGFLSIHLGKTHRGTAIVNGSLRADCRHGAEAPIGDMAVSLCPTSRADERSGLPTVIEVSAQQSGGQSAEPRSHRDGRPR